jgi:glycosyltransferase involved in cell wall biosynthesis
MMRIQPDTGIFEKFPVLKEKPYFFAMSSMARNKNHAWIIRVARKNLSYTFAIAGNINERIFGNTHIQTAENVLLLGYVSDEEAKALMQRCEVFIFPTFYEGFGIPPMEAMSCGARAIVSNASCMPEIYSDSVYYIDPWRDEVDLSRVLKVQIGSAQKLLDNYSWEKSAQQLKSILKSMERSDSDLPVFY